MHAGLGAAREHDVGVAAPDQLRPLPDRVRAGSARRDGRVVRAAEAEVDRDLPARRVDEHVRDEPRRHPRVAALARARPAARGRPSRRRSPSRRGSRPRRIDPVDAGVSHASRAAATASTTFRSSLRASFGADDALRLEPLHLGRDPYRELARVEGADEVHPAPPRDGRLPGRARVVAERGDGSEAGDRDATHGAEPSRLRLRPTGRFRAWLERGALPREPVERPADLDPAVPFPPMEAELVRELPERRRLAVRAEVGRLPRASRERLGRAQALVAQREAAAPLLPGARGRSVSSCPRTRRSTARS